MIPFHLRSGLAYLHLPHHPRHVPSRFAIVRICYFVISSVCAGWRRSAIDEKFLWSHVDIDLTSPTWLCRAQLWLDRAGKIPIHVHFGRSQPFGLAQSPAAAILLLEPYMNSLASLNLHLLPEYWSSASYLLNAFARQCKQGLASSLSVSAPPDISYEIGTSFPRSLEGLLDLQLSDLDIPACPSFIQIIEMISDSPSMGALRLQNVHSKRFSDDRLSFTPIILPELKLVELTGMHPTQATHLLSILTPGILKLDLRLDTWDYKFTTPACLDFFRCSNIKSLYLFVNMHPKAWFIDYFPLMPRLRVLFLDFTSARVPIDLSPLSLSTAEGKVPALPGLQTIFLLNATLDDVAIRRLNEGLSPYSLRKILFVACDLSKSRASENKVAGMYSVYADKVWFLRGGWQNERILRDSFIQVQMIGEHD